MKKITTRISEISYDNFNRLLRVEFFKDIEIELEDAIQNYEAACSLTQGEKYLKIVVAKGSMISSKDARAYVAEIKKNDGRIAEALIFTSTANKLIGNFYINFNKPKVPTRVFSSEEKAKEWLNSFLYLSESHQLPKLNLRRL